MKVEQDIVYDFKFVRLLHERFKHILYEDKKHVYYNLLTKGTLTSVTSYIKNFKPVFQKEYWLNQKAKEKGVTVEELDREWKEAKDTGLAIGNNIHNYIERRCKREWVLPKNPQVEEYLNSHDDITLFTEFIIGNDKIGGRFDNLSLRGDDLILKDWKTNKKLDLTSNYTLINGLEHLPQCEYYEYALQLSLYQYILGLPITKRELVWFKREGGFEIFDLPYLEDEVKHMLSWQEQ